MVCLQFLLARSRLAKRLIGQASSVAFSTPATPTIVSVTYERPQTATNNFNVFEGALAQFDLRLEGRHVPYRDRWDNKMAEVMKPTQ